MGDIAMCGTKGYGLLAIFALKMRKHISHVGLDMVWIVHCGHEYYKLEPFSVSV